MEHIMIDIETMGTHSSASIISIAAIKFDLKTGKTGKEFYTNVDLQSCIDIGMLPSADTILWWMDQDEKAKEVLFKDEIKITKALNQLHIFCSGEYYIWANPPSFDCVILKEAFRRIKMKTPWRYFNERDVMTIKSLAPELAKSIEFKGVKHNALDDCKHQIKVIIEVLNNKQLL